MVGIALDAAPEDADIAGFFNFAPAAQQVRAFLWQNGSMSDLGTLGGNDAMASVINENGAVSGFSSTNAELNDSTGLPTIHPFLWKKGRMTDLGTLGGSVSEAFAINDAGQVVGRARVTDAPLVRHAFVWEQGTMTDLGTVDPCTRGTATSINTNG